MKNRKYFVALSLAVAFILTPSANWRIATAQTPTIAELQAQIAALQRQLAILLGQQDNTGTWCHTFNTNLRIGMTGNEVSALQTALTRAGFGVSATGSYDENTAAAASGFQERYRSEILTQLGLIAPTGYFGPATRAVMNRLYGCDRSTVDQTPSLTNPPSIISASSKAANLNQLYTGELGFIDGENFLSNNTVYLKGDNNNNTSISALNSRPADRLIFFTVPSTLPSGFYWLAVGNANGISNGLTVTIVNSQSASPIPPATSSLTVTAPNSGSYVAGASLSVTWTSANIPSGTLVNVGVFNSAGTANASYLANTANDGAQTLTLRSDAPAGQYRIRITATVNGQLVTAYGDWISVASATLTPSLTVSVPANNTSWTSSNGPIIQWSSANIPSGNQITVEFLTPTNGQVSGFSSFSTNNDGSESGRLTNSAVASGAYYFRLSTVVNGQTIYGGSGVFQFTGAETSTITLRGIRLRVTDQTTSAGLGGVTVIINRGGTYVATQTTDSDGWTPAISLRVGESHTFSFSKAGYQNRSAISMTIPAGSAIYTYGPVALQAETVTSPVAAYTLNLITAGTGSGLTSRNPNQTNYPAGTVVTITASPTNGSTFTGWSGSRVSAANPTTVTMNANKNVYANFAAATVTPPPPATPSLTVSVPANNTSWTSTNGPVIQWSSANIPSGNQITVELLTPANQQVSGFSSFTTTNDSSESGRLTNSTVASGSYYFRLSTVVNGQPVYGGSGVFQFSQPSAAASITVSSPSTNSTWSPTNSPVVSWSTVGVTDSQNILIELLTPSGGSVSGFTSRSVRNDQRPAFNLLTNSTVASGSYYFRLSTVVNSQTIYGGSGVFQFNQPSAAASITVSAPTSSSQWLAGSAQTVRWTASSISDFYQNYIQILDSQDSPVSGFFGAVGEAWPGQKEITIPATLLSGLYRIRVVIIHNNSNSTLMGVSDQFQVTR